MALAITGVPEADALLTDNPFALLAGMMLDQQYPMEHAFRGPAKVLERFGSFTPADVAAADPEAFAALCTTPPAVHRFPGSMAARLQELARLIEENYDGHAERIWTEAADGSDLNKRLLALPGFGAQKARIFVALLAKQVGVQACRVGEGRGRLRRGRLPLGGRRRRPGVAAEGPGLQEGEEGRRQGEGLGQRRVARPPARRTPHVRTARRPCCGGSG